MIPIGAIEDVLFDVAEALRTPVLVAALIAVAITLLELGGLLVELLKRRRRRFTTLELASDRAAQSLYVDKDAAKARAWMRQAAWSPQMASTLDFIVERCQTSGSRPAVAKSLADFDFTSLRRLERTRLLVRFGPALGLMGTLIPLSPALAGLAKGNIDQLADNLRIAFSVTVIGLLVGAVAFAMSLVRDRLYGQDHSDLEYAANVLTTPRTAATAAAGGAGSAPKPVEPPPVAPARQQRTARPPEQARKQSKLSTFTLPGFKKRGQQPQPAQAPAVEQMPHQAAPAPAPAKPDAAATAVIPPATPAQPGQDAPEPPSQSAADTSPTPSEGTGEKT